MESEEGDRETADRGALESEEGDRETADRGTAESDRSAPADTAAASFGIWLRRQREGRGIELQEIAEETKISLVNLRAFEQDRFDILPAPVFARGFLRQYARYVGLDPEEVVNFYISACRSGEGEEETITPTAEPRTGSSWKLGALALALTLACALLIWQLTRWNDRPPGFSPLPAAATTQAEPAAGAGSTRLKARPAGLEPGVEPGSRDTASAEPASGAPEPTVAADGAPLRVTLDFSGACWVEAAVDGERQVAENKIQGESLLLEAAEMVELTIGNIDVVAVEVNGLPFEFVDVPGTKVRTQRIDLKTVAALTGPGADGGGA